MRWRVLLTLSLLANAALAVGLVVSARRAGNPATTASLEEANAAAVRTNVVVRHQFISWSHVESPDYSVYIANLRSIGCPEQTVRDIIIADVNALYAKRRALEVISPLQEWWRSEPDPAVVKLAADKYIALDNERRALLTKLLGPDWEGGDLASLPRPTRQGVVLDGPILGNLSADTKASVDSISVQAQERLQAYMDAMRNAGKTPDPAELARMRQETRIQLAGVLTPAQLEEYLLRYSQTANDLRAQLGKLKFFNATADEFRALFRAADPLDQQIALLGPATDPMTTAQRASLEQQRDSAIRLALGADRFLLFQKLQDPLYQQAMAQATQAGDPSTADAIYGINLAAQNEQSQIQTNANLTDSQRAIAQKQLDLDQLKATTEASGQPTLPEPPTPTPPPQYETHVMGQTETVAALARLYQVPMSEIQALNPGVNLDSVRPGDAVRIPPPTPPLMVPFRNRP